MELEVAPGTVAHKLLILFNFKFVVSILLILCINETNTLSSKLTRARSIVHNYFVVEDDGSAECNICAKMLKTTSGNTSSMRRHFESLHKDKFNEMLAKEIEINHFEIECCFFKSKMCTR